MTPNIENALAWILIAFYAIGGFVNFIAPKKIQAEYARWGYPKWFHYVTAACELSTAALLLFSTTRFFGVALGVASMLGAVVTVVRYREYAHAVPPTIFLILTLFLGWFSFGVA